MQTGARLSIEGSTAILTYSAGEENALDETFCAHVSAALDAAIGNKRIAAILIRPNGSVVGNIPAKSIGPVAATFRSLCAKIRNAGKLVFFQMHGAMQDHAIEFALSCSHRIAAPNTTWQSLGLKQGMSPIAGASQQIARLGPLSDVLALYCNGVILDASTLANLGWVDAIVEQVSPAGLLSIQSARANSKGQVDRIYQQLIHAQREKYQGDQKFAHERLLGCFEAAQILPFDLGLAYEETAFEDCLAQGIVRAPSGEAVKAAPLGASAGTVASHPQKPAQLNTGIGVREKKVAIPTAGPRPQSDTEPAKIAMLGAGPQSLQFIQKWLTFADRITVFDADAAALKQLQMRVVALAQKSEARDQVLALLRDRLVMSNQYEALQDHDIYVDLGRSDPQIITRNIETLRGISAANAWYLVTATGLDLDPLVRAGRGEINVAALWTEFAVGGRTFEISVPFSVAGQKIDHLRDRLRGLRVETLRTGAGDQSVAMSLALHLQQAVEYQLCAGATGKDLADAIRKFGFRQDIWQLFDAIGLGRLSNAQKNDRFLMTDANRPSFILSTAVSQGYARVGLMRPSKDQSVLGMDILGSLALQEAERLEIERTEFDADDFMLSIDLALANCGARLVGSGRVEGQVQLDKIACVFLGYPTARTGPLFQASQRGWTATRQLLRARMSQSKFWKPCMAVRAASNLGYLGDAVAESA